MYEIQNVSTVTVRSVATAEDRLQKFPFEQLGVGQSFFVPNLPNGRAKPAPFDTARKQFPDRKFNRKVDSVEVTNLDENGNGVTTVVYGVRYGRTA